MKLVASGEKWLKFLNELEGQERIIFSGGEPTLHPDFVQIMDHIWFKGVWLYTNLSKIALVRLLEVRRPLYLYISYHPSQADKVFWDRYERIKKSHHVVFTPHQPMDGQHEKDPRSMFHKLVGYDSSGQFRHGDSPESRFDRKRLRKVLCSLDNFPIDPVGDVYPCNEDAYRKTNSLGNVFNGFDLSHLPEMIYCDHYGYCNPCESGKQVEFL